MGTFHADGVADIVLARSSHNASKSDLFAATRHVLAMALAGYGHVPDQSPLWPLRRTGGPGREVERLTPDPRAEISQLLGDEGQLELVAEDPGRWSPT